MLTNQPPKPPARKSNAYAIDNRVKDSMPWWGSGIAIAAAIAYNLVPAGMAAAILVLTSVVLALGHDLLHPALSERLSVVAICNVWAVAVARMWHVCGIRTSLVLTPLSLFVITSSIGWARWGQSRRRSASVQNHTSNMLDRRADWHIVEGLSHFAPGIEHESIIEIPRGVRWTLKTARTGTENGKKVLAAIVERLPVPRRFVRIFEHEHADKTIVEYTPADLPRELWPVTPNQDVDQGCAVAKDENKNKVIINPIGNHVFVGGMSDAGKSRFMMLFCAWAVAATNGALVVVDIVKHGDDYRMFKDHALMWGHDVESCRKALATVLGIMDTRYTLKDYHGNWQPTPEAPQLFVVIDEGAAINRDKVCKPILQKLAAESRGAGITLVVGTQFPHFELFPKDVMANINYRFCLRVKSREGANMIIPGLGARAMQIPKGGHCFVDSPDYGEPALARIWHVESDAMEAFAATHKPVVRLGVDPAGGVQAMPAPAIGTPPARSEPQVTTVAGVAADSDSQVELDEFAGPVLRVLGEAVGALNQTEIQRLSGLGNPRTVKKAAGRLVALGFATEHTSTSWSVTEAGRAHLERQEVKA